MVLNIYHGHICLVLRVPEPHIGTSPTIWESFICRKNGLQSVKLFKLMESA